MFSSREIRLLNNAIKKGAVIMEKNQAMRRCPKCGGAWYDQDELRQLKEKESGGDYRWLHVDLWQDAAKVTVEKR